MLTRLRYAIFSAYQWWWPVHMSQNTLFNYFSRSPAAASSGASKTTGSPCSATPSKRQSSKQNSATPKRTPKSVNGSAKKDKVSDNCSSKKTTEKRKPKKLGKYLFNSTNCLTSNNYLKWYLTLLPWKLVLVVMF